MLNHTVTSLFEQAQTYGHARSSLNFLIILEYIHSLMAGISSKYGNLNKQKQQTTISQNSTV